MTSLFLEKVTVGLGQWLKTFSHLLGDLEQDIIKAKTKELFNSYLCALSLKGG